LLTWRLTDAVCPPPATEKVLAPAVNGSRAMLNRLERGRRSHGRADTPSTCAFNAVASRACP